MTGLRKIEVSIGVFWIEAPKVDARILCGCPADVVKHLMKRGLVAPRHKGGVRYESGPNAILLSDVMVQNGAFSNLAEFPVLQMLYRQGMILPNHPGNTGAKPLLIGSTSQVRAQMHYIYRGNYGLVSEAELIDAGIDAAEAHEIMRLKLRFAFGAIRDPSELLDTVELEGEPRTLCGGLTVRRTRLNVFEFALDGETVEVDLNLPPYETYECPYPLGFFDIPRAYFAVVHSGEGDGWDINRPSMGSILMFQGRIYLIDAGPNILMTLATLGIGVNEIEGIFHTHSHDDHFAGLTTLIRADHRIKYYAAPMVRAAVAKKMAALLTISEAAFADYFEVIDLVPDVWNEVGGLEVRPVFSPHPVETTLFVFRAMWEGGYRTYAHFADICRLELLQSFVTDDPSRPGVSAALYERIVADYAVPADIKKIDIGGGLIHGDAYDFRDDASGKIILAHTSEKLTMAQRAIGSTAAFGTVDILIPSDQDFIRRAAHEVLTTAFPEVPEHEIRVLLNNPAVTFNPGTILLKERQTAKEVWIILTGSIEAISADGRVRSVLSAGAIVGEMSGLFGALAAETYRAQGFVKALKISCPLYSEFVRRNQLLRDIARLLEHREFLQRTWLFGEVVSTKTLNRVARELRSEHLAAGVTVDVGPESIGMVESGRIGRYVGDRMVSAIADGDFFGEELSIFWTPSMFRLRTLEPTEILILPADLVAGVPSIRWRLFEAWGKRTNVYADEEPDEDDCWRRIEDSLRIDVLRVDEQHHRLFELMNAAVRTLAGADPAEVVAAIDALAAYADYHFGEEEALLDQAEYPESASHRQSHAHLAARLHELRQEIASGALALPGDVEAFLRPWLTEHILNEDRAFGMFLHSKGIY